MCGIVGVFDLKTDVDKLRPQVLEMSKKIRHRGPDWSGIYCDSKAIPSVSPFITLIGTTANCTK